MFTYLGGKLGKTYFLNPMTEFSSFLGVDSGAGRKPFTYVALDSNRRLLAVGSGGAVDVLSFAAGQPSVLVALSAPQRPGSLKPGATSEPPLPVHRLSQQRETQLDLTGQALATPGADMPSWLAASFGLVSQLQALGGELFPAQAARQWLETPAESGFISLLGVEPFDIESLEGRLQRQLALFDLELDVPDAMDFFEEITRFKLLRGILPYHKVLPPGELNAWLAANTAWQAVHQPHRVQRAGDAESGVVTYPLPAEKARR